MTAQKRSQSIQDVPISVTAFNGAALENNGAVNLEDLSGIAPNVQLTQMAIIPNVGSFTIRGINFTDPAPTPTPKPGSPSTAFPSCATTACSWTCSTSRASRCCAGRRARSTAATTWRAPSSFRGALTPAVAGGIADALGTHTVPFVSLVAAVLGVAVVLFGLREPKPAPTGTRGRS